MSNIAVIVAGGVGSRMHQDIPKQFINVYDKPVIIYTLESFQKHPEVDAIEVVCIDGWHDMLWAYAKQFNITKLKWVIGGGDSAQGSIAKGIYNLENEAKPDETISLDFSEVKVLAPSWADEFITNLKSAYPNKIEFLNTDNESVRESLKWVG